tara:strand:+ start:219 stop:788 length:570 start_codon:yes stop_codon:yes gene_type:complete
MGSFWSDASEGVKDPKRQFRWILVNDHIPVYTLKKVSKPSFTVQESTHKYINHTFYYPGRVEWNTISLTLADPVDPDGAATMTDIIRTGGYSPAMDETMLSTMSKSKATNALGRVEIQQIDSDGDMIEKWILWNPWIKDVKFGDLDYDGDDLTDIEIEIRYDWAYLETANESTRGTTGSWNPGNDSSTF